MMAGSPQEPDASGHGMAPEADTRLAKPLEQAVACPRRRPPVSGSRGNGNCRDGSPYLPLECDAGKKECVMSKEPIFRPLMEQVRAAG